METISVQLSQRGVIVLPQSLRKTYNLNPGDTLTLTDIGGVFILSPHRSEIDNLAHRIQNDFEKSGETLENMLLALREEREKYGE